MNHIQNTLFLQRVLASFHNLKSKVTQWGMCHPLQMGKKSRRELNNCRASSPLTQVSGHGFPKDCSCNTDSIKEVRVHTTVCHSFGCLFFTLTQTF